MEVTGLIAIAAAVCIAISTVFPAISQGKATCKAMEAIGRQPEAAGDVRTTLIVALAFMEALTIYGLLIALLMLGKI